MVLLSPGVEVTTIDESQFSSNDFRDAVPLIVLATVEDKAASSGTGTAPLTSKANSNTPFLMASSRELIQNFGTPVFFEINGTPQHGFELNEYGLLTANKMLNVGNRCWVIRADIDMNELVSNSTAPTAPALDNTHWFDIDDTEFGIFQFVAGAWVLIAPRIVNDVNDLSGAAPASSIGKDGDFAVVTVSNSTTLGNNRVYQRLTGQWRNVGSSAWDLESDTTLTGTTPYLSATDNTITSNVGAGDTLDMGPGGAIVQAGTAQTATVTSTISAADPILALGLTTMTLQGTNLTMFSTTIGDKLTGTTNLANAITTGIPGLEVGDQMRVHAWDTTPGASVNDTATMNIVIVGDIDGVANPSTVTFAEPVVDLATETLIFDDGLGGSITVTFTNTGGDDTLQATVLTDINNAVSTPLGIVATIVASRLVLTKATLGNNNTNAINITGGTGRGRLGYLIGTDLVVVGPFESGLNIVAFPATMSVEQSRRSFYDDFSNLETDGGTTEMAVNISVFTGGDSGFVVGDVITLTGGTGTTAKCQVTSVGAGIITGIKLEIDYTANTIAFGNTTDMTDSASGFDGGAGGDDIFEIGDVVEVSGSTSNDGIYTIASVAAGTIVFNEDITDEVAGASITVTRVDERGGLYTALPTNPVRMGSQTGIGVVTVIKADFDLTYANQSNVAVNTVGSVSFDLEFETNADGRAMFIENVTGAPIGDLGILSTRTSVDLPGAQTILGTPADITAAGNPIALTKNTTTNAGAITIGAGNALVVLGFTADTFLVNLQEVVNEFNGDAFPNTTASIITTGGLNFIKITNTLSDVIQMGGTAATKLGLSTALVAVSQLFFAEHFNVPVGPAEGDVWIKTTSPNNGANYIIRFLNPASGQFELLPAELFADNAAAFDDFRTSGIGVTPVVTTVAVGDLYIQYDVDGDGTASSRIMRYNGSTTLAITSSGTFSPVAGTLDISNGRTGAGTSATLTLNGSETISDFAALINDAAVTSIEASVNATGFIVITNTIGEDIVLTDNSIAWTIVLFNPGTFSNWVPLRTVTLATGLTGYTPSADIPTTTPVTGTYWFDGDVSATEIDLLEHNGTTWVTFTNDLQVAATKPTLQSDDSSALVQGDLWIDSSDLELFPNIFRWNGTLLKFEQVDNTDQTTTAGILFADVRPTATTVELDPDAPNPNLFPTGMLLWNGRASSMNVKIQKTNWFGDDFGGTAGDVSFDPDTDFTVNTYKIGDATLGPLANGKSRWVTASGNKVDGSPFMGRNAQRQIVIEKMAAAMQVDEILDPRARFFNLILAPFYHELMDEMVTLNNTRRETGFIIGDTPARLAPNTTSLLNWATNANSSPSNDDNGLVTREENLAVYYPPLGLTTNLDGTEVAMPSSLGALLAYVNNDNVAFPWFAPAGLTRGLMSGIFTSMGFLTGEDEFEVVTLNRGQQDTLYTNNVNPIIFTPGRGLYINGQKTLHNQTSALDRVNVARLIVFLRFQLELLAEPFLFEINDELTRDQVKDTFDRFFADLLGLRAIFDFLVVVDETNNTPTRIDRNELWIDIAIQPAKVIEFIFIPIRIKNTGEALTN